MSESLAVSFIRTFPTLADLQSMGPDPEALSTLLLGAPMKFLESQNESVLLPSFGDMLLPVSAKLCREGESCGPMSRHYVELGVSMLGTIRRRVGASPDQSLAYRAALSSFRDTLQDIEVFCQWFSEDVSGNAGDVGGATTGGVSDTAVLCVCAYPHCDASEEASKATFMRCSKCFAASGVRVPYCSQKCQEADWPRHKDVCGKSFDEFKDAALKGPAAATAEAEGAGAKDYNDDIDD